MSKIKDFFVDLIERIFNIPKVAKPVHPAMKTWYEKNQYDKLRLNIAKFDPDKFLMFGDEQAIIMLDNYNYNLGLHILDNIIDNQIAHTELVILATQSNKLEKDLIAKRDRQQGEGQKES